MTTAVSVGRSTLRDPVAAAREAATSARKKLDGKAPTFALAFATTGYPLDTLCREVRTVVGPGATFGGCSGEGIISGDASNESNHAVAVLLMASTSIQVDVVASESYARDSAVSAKELGEKIRAMRDVFAVMVLTDGLGGDCTAFLQTLAREVPCPNIVGGAAADAMVFEKTFQFVGERVLSGAACALVFRGQGELRYSVSHGCSAIGPERTVTRAAGGWVQEIDGRPAWSVFKEYLDGDPQDLNADGIVHLCIGTPLEAGGDTSDATKCVIRTPLALDKATGALMFPGGGLEAGQRIRMTRRDADRIRQTAVECADSVSHGQQARPSAVFQFDCAGRGKVMFGSCASDEIVKPLQERMSAEVPWIGFHTYGEIAPLRGEPRYHNYTVALCALYERA
ncbi:MAG: FIST C-terminal domain-containing protein [Myxococcaceae bacterium]|nr:FIST C-terminal domain-containing protein [Myxococcaceae bacterium]